MTLYFLFERALVDVQFDNLAVHDPEDDRDALLTLLAIYALPPESATHPAVTALKSRLELWLIGCIDARMGADTTVVVDVTDAIAAIAERSHDTVYEWLATSADWQQLRGFLSLESEQQPREDMHTSALFRLAIRGLLSSNRDLFPEYLGAQALTQRQSEARRNLLVSALHRLGAPANVIEALAFQVEATVLEELDPDWLPRMIRGARWQADVDGRFFRDCHTLLATHELQTA